MWRTSSGERVIKGAEATLIKAAMMGVVELIKDEVFRGGVQW